MHYKDFVPIIPSNANPIDWPLFNKVRDLHPGEERGGAVPPGRMYDAILWPFNRRIHFSTVWDVPKNDIPWHTKKGPKLLWRGDYNVASPMHLKTKVDLSGPLQKWLLVHNYHESPHVDAMYFSPQIKPENIPSQYISTKPMTKKEMLQHKYLLSLEGHDMSSGLKWMLFSNSCVFMVWLVTWDSWAMETKLQPFVHFIPLHANMSNVRHQIQWAQQHDKEA